MTDHISSYPTVYNLGHAAIQDIFSSEVQVEEKVDGSSMSFMLSEDGELLCRSKGAQLILDAPEGMFVRAVESVVARKQYLTPGWVYRSEYLQKPKHNVLAYDRTPDGYLIGFDVMTGVETYLSYDAKKAEFARIGLECVPLLYKGMVSDVEQFKALLDTVSILGGSKIEGVVVKNYAVFTRDKKIAIGKYVSEAFKETHAKEWKGSDSSGKDITAILIATYRSIARWQKAVQHLRERGVLENSPRDIGALIKEARIDLKRECEEEIKDILFKHFWPQIERGTVSGLPEWYKEELLKSAFDENEKPPD